MTKKATSVMPNLIDRNRIRRESQLPLLNIAFEVNKEAVSQLQRELDASFDAYRIAHRHKSQKDLGWFAGMGRWSKDRQQFMNAIVLT